ncbi:MAG TPA: protein kinase [Thermoanaerobaculia bacterium]|nr:protein kinase [Thermoanaerobaculia bacterium]
MIADSIGRYRILRQIGSGGMGEVYLAEDPKLQRNVALKLLSDPDEKAKRRFVREAITASQLSHPNVAVVYEAGESDDGTAFIAMQYVEGETLRDRLHRGPMPIDAIVRLSSEVADALDEAHRRGIVHRDIKPGNIMIDGRGHAKVLDFGIAKTIDVANTHEPTAVADTAAGMFVGTLQYVSPEQASGGVVDRRSDIFSFGVVMHEMLTGSNSVTTPITRSDCPPELKKIVARCLEKDPERRYQTARDIVIDLAHIAEKPLRRSDRRIVLVVMVLLVATAGLWLFERPPRQAARASRAKIDSVAVLPFANFSPQRENEFIGDGISEEVINGLAQLSGLKVVSRTSSFAFKGTRADVRELGKSLGVDALVEGSVQRSGSRLRVTAQLINAHDGYHLWSQTYSGGVDDVFSIEDQIARAVAQALQRTMGRQAAGPSTRDVAAYDLYLKARHEESIQTPTNFDNAVAYYRAAIQRDPSFAEAYAGLAETYSLMDHRPGMTTLPPKETYRLATETASRALSIDPDSAEAHAAIGHIDMHLGRFDEARAHLDRAVQINPNLSNAHLWRAVLMRTLGHYAEARADLERAEQLDPRSAFVTTIMSTTLTTMGDYTVAIRVLLRGIEIEPRYGELHANLARAYALNGEFREAEAALRRAEELRTSTLEPTQALVWALAGRTAEAAQLLRRVDRTALPQAGPFMMRAWAAAGNVDEAVRWADRMVAETPDYGRIAIDIPPHPALQKLRTDPRFLSARRKLGLPPLVTDTTGTSTAVR